MGGIQMGGVGIGAMRHIGMMAMLPQIVGIYYNSLMFAISILAAHIVATFVLFIKFVSLETGLIQEIFQ